MTPGRARRAELAVGENAGPGAARRPRHRSGSAMQARSFGIDEDRVADLDLDVAVAHRIEGAHALADALAARAASSPSPIQWPSVGEKATEVM